MRRLSTFEADQNNDGICFSRLLRHDRTSVDIVVVDFEVLRYDRNRLYRWQCRLVTKRRIFYLDPTVGQNDKVPSPRRTIFTLPNSSSR